MKKLPDIDIDFRSDFSPPDLFKWTRASLVRDGELAAHPCGYYPQDIPVDQLTGLSAIPYEQAESMGFFKIDFLHLNVYNSFMSRAEIEELVKIEPNWNLLTNEDVQGKLFQLSKHGDILNDIRPRSIPDLADVLALIRPGKKNLIKLYKANKEATRRLLYSKDEQGYSFKKSHAIAYSLVIVLQLHLVELGLI